MTTILCDRLVCLSDFVKLTKTKKSVFIKYVLVVNGTGISSVIVCFTIVLEKVQLVNIVLAISC